MNNKKKSHKSVDIRHRPSKISQYTTDHPISKCDIVSPSTMNMRDESSSLNNSSAHNNSNVFSSSVNSTSNLSIKTSIPYSKLNKNDEINDEESSSCQEEEEEEEEFSFQMRSINSESASLLPDSTKPDNNGLGKGVCGGSEESGGEESFWSVSVQIFIPFLIAGLGMVGAGLILDIVQHWPVFNKVPELFILVPALLGLKGNLEMTLASRLSTQANLGNLDSSTTKWNLAFGNISLVQCQAIVVGLLASISAVILGWIPTGKFNLNHFLILCSSSVVTASLASLVLSTIMVCIIILSRSLRVNPDNVATPIAASLGDLTTLSVLACVSNFIYGAVDTHKWLAPLVLAIYICSIPVWISLAKKNTLTRKVLYSGWNPVLSAMVISSFGGLILDYTVKRFSGIAVFQPVISGVGGNLVAVQASRLATSLHRTCKLGSLPNSSSSLCSNPIRSFFSKEIHSVTARALVLMTAPGHLIFLFFLQAGHGHTSFTPIFILSYLLAAQIQVILLLYTADILVKFLWSRGIDPDDSAIPYLTALGDLIGTGLLSFAFMFLFWIGDRDTDVGD